MKDIFISHSSIDKPTIVRKLNDELCASGIDVWLDENVILCGDNILEQIEKGIENSLCVALILTPSFFQSNWASLEIGLAKANTSGTHIVPVMTGIAVEDVAKKYAFLLTQKYVSLSSLDIPNAARELAKTVESLRARKRIDEPLDYQGAVRKLNNFDTPGTNTVSILVTEYAQICKISVDAGISHAAKIGVAVIDDVSSEIPLN